MVSQLQCILPLAIAASFLGLNHVESATRNWCPEQQEQWDAASNSTQSNGTATATAALAGKKIKCGAVVYPPFSVYDEATGTWSGFDVELFAEVARRGEFEYEIIKLDGPPEGKTFDHVLYGVGREMDMMCTWWGVTAARKQRNMDFTIPTIDTSFILAAPNPKPVQEAFKDKFWTFLAPFSRDLWLVLLFGVMFTAIVYHFINVNIRLPHGNEDSYEQQQEQEEEARRGGLLRQKETFFSICHNFYQGWVLCTVQDPYKNPSTPWAKIYLMSWTGVIIVLLAAYTAQLTTFLIVELNSISSIGSLDDLIRSGKPACALTHVSFVNTFLKNSAPSLPVTPIKTIDEAFPAVRSGKCGAALLGKSEVELMIAGNTKCDMRMVGSPLNFLAGAYAADAGKCGGFVLGTADAILQGIREDGTLDEMWEKYVEKPVECAKKTATTTEDQEEATKSLSLKSVGGLFIIHAAFAFLAIVGWAAQQFLMVQRSRKVIYAGSPVKANTAEPTESTVKMLHSVIAAEEGSSRGKGKGVSQDITITPESSGGLPGGHVHA